MPSNALAIFQKIENPIEAARQIGEAIYESGMIKLNNSHAGTVVALTCMDEGITPLEFNRKYHMIGNTPSQKAWSMLADFVEAGGDYVIKSITPDLVEIEFVYNDKTTPASTTWEVMQQSRWPWKDWTDHEKGLKDNWATPEDRENQLFSRLISKWLKRIAPELFFGVYTPEEMRDVIEVEATVVESAPVPTPEEAAGITAAEKVAEQTPATDDAVEYDPAMDLIVGKIENFCKLLEIDDKGQQEILQKRGVEKWTDLTTEQAEEIEAKLQSVYTAKQAEKQ